MVLCGRGIKGYGWSDNVDSNQFLDLFLLLFLLLSPSSFLTRLNG
jgi:hypothetical protein